jgi:hypothetical protein
MREIKFDFLENGKIYFNTSREFFLVKKFIFNEIGFKIIYENGEDGMIYKFVNPPDEKFFLVEDEKMINW